jgi:hypothetical protein
MAEGVRLGEEVNTYIFYRDDMFYMIELMDDADAVANAECNPGTRRVEDMRGNQVWPEKPKVVH